MKEYKSGDVTYRRQKSPILNNSIFFKDYFGYGMSMYHAVYTIGGKLKWFQIGFLTDSIVYDMDLKEWSKIYAEAVEHDTKSLSGKLCNETITTKDKKGGE